MLDSSTAFDLEVDVIGRLAATRSQWANVAASLHAFRAGEGWKALDETVPSFTAWLGKPEIGMGYRHATGLIDIWQCLAIDHRVDRETLAGLDPSKILVVLPAIKANRVPVLEALSDAQTMSRSDLREHYATGNATAPLPPCRCEKCGNTHRAAA